MWVSLQSTQSYNGNGIPKLGVSGFRFSFPLTSCLLPMELVPWMVPVLVCPCVPYSKLPMWVMAIVPEIGTLGMTFHVGLMTISIAQVKGCFHHGTCGLAGRTLESAKP